MMILISRRCVFFYAACLLALTCCEPEGVQIDLNGDTVTMAGAFHGGRWTARLDGFRTSMEPGDPLEWTLHFAMDARGLASAMKQVKELDVVLSAMRINDAEGHYRGEDAFFTSTYLTPSGLPVEGFQYLTPNTKIGGPYITPLDYVKAVMPQEIRLKGDQIDFETRISTALDTDFPPGLYRYQVTFYALVNGVWIKLPFLTLTPDGQTGAASDNMDFYKKILLPPVRVGTIKAPRMIWTLFTLRPNLGVSGVVAREDAADFGISNRVRLGAKYILPCNPEREDCTFVIEPDFPTIGFLPSFSSFGYPYSPIERGPLRIESSVRVKRPDGQVDDLGTHLIRQSPVLDFLELAGGPSYRFRQFGKYEIRMTGFYEDKYGNRFEGGGTYEVWVAIPLTFATGIKPNTPMQVGHSYPPAAMINPPVPADVTATVRFYPGPHPTDMQERVYTGKAQRFGYFFPDPAEHLLLFPVPGEYLFDIFATYTDERGRVYMGNMKNASVVLPEKPNMGLHGWPNDIPHPMYREGTIALMEPSGLTECQMLFPYRSGDILYYPGNAENAQSVQPTVAAFEPTGGIRDHLLKHFAWPLVTIAADPAKLTMINEYTLPGNTEAFLLYAQNDRWSAALPLMSTTSEGYSPFSFPELVRQRGYFYTAVSRPGFPVFFSISDSTIGENYWLTGFNAYKSSIGAPARGDQPGDIYWAVVAGLFADPENGRLFYGQYSTGGVVTQRGKGAPFIKGPFEMPVARINGADLYIYGGVGPSPGALYETGAVKGVGSIAVPMVPHNVQIDIVKPDGEVKECRGRADAIGNYNCPGPLVLDVPGVYRVYSKLWEGDKEGTCPGARGGWYKIYCVRKDSPFRVLFDSKMARTATFEGPLKIAGRVDPPIRDGTVYYSMVAPGLLLDEGEMPTRDGHFDFLFRADQFASEFQNIEEPVVGLDYLHPRLKDVVLDFFKGKKSHSLSDTVEVVVFIEGHDEDGREATAGGKFVIRGKYVVVPPQFRDAAGEARR